MSVKGDYPALRADRIPETRTSAPHSRLELPRLVTGGACAALTLREYFRVMRARLKMRLRLLTCIDLGQIEPLGCLPG
jgi:hypothetical protein